MRHKQSSYRSAAILPLPQTSGRLTNGVAHTQGQHKLPQVISTGRCQHIWPTYAVIGWLTKTRTAALLWLV